MLQSQSLKERIKSRPWVKKLAMSLLANSYNARPRWYIRWLVNPFVHRVSGQAHIAGSVRLDVLPTQPFVVGKGAVIESFSVINNGVGPVTIGENTLVGMGNVVIGPVQLGRDIIMAQHVVLSGLNHEYKDVSRPIRSQPVTTAPIVIGDGSWIAANAVITAGVTIGKHCVIAAGSVVTKDVPDYCIAAGNPAKVIKQYDHQTALWQRPEATAHNRATG